MTSRPPTLLLASRLRSELERLFAEAAQLDALSVDAGSFLPSLDVIDGGDWIRVLVDVPGVRREDLAVEIAGAEIVIRGSKQTAVPAGEATFHCLERQRGRFERRLRISWPVNGHRARARLAGGVLTIELPRIVEQRQRSVPIAIEPGPTPNPDP